MQSSVICEPLMERSRMRMCASNFRDGFAQPASVSKMLTIPYTEGLWKSERSCMVLKKASLSILVFVMLKFSKSFLNCATLAALLFLSNHTAN